MTMRVVNKCSLEELRVKAAEYQKKLCDECRTCFVGVTCVVFDVALLTLRIHSLREVLHQVAVQTNYNCLLSLCE